MDSISDSDSEDIGSIPIGTTFFDFAFSLNVETLRWMPILV